MGGARLRAAGAGWTLGGAARSGTWPAKEVAVGLLFRASSRHRCRLGCGQEIRPQGESEKEQEGEVLGLRSAV